MKTIKSKPLKPIDKATGRDKPLAAKPNTLLGALKNTIIIKGEIVTPTGGDWEALG